MSFCLAFQTQALDGKKMFHFFLKIFYTAYLNFSDANYGEQDCMSCVSCLKSVIFDVGLKS